MKWSDQLPGFCESVISGPPEPVNAVTSLFMVFYGLMGLFVTRNHNIIIRVTSAMLSVTGAGSVIYHWNLHNGWGQIDALPMLMSSYLGAYMAFDAVIFKKIAVDMKRRRLYEHVSGVLALLFMTGLALSLALSVAEDTSHLFSILFAIPELLIAVGVILIRTVSYVKERSSGDPGLIRAFNIMYIGMGSAIAAAIFWFTTELLCKEHPWLRFLYAHGIWHATISIGMYFLMQFLVYVYSSNTDKNPYWVEGDRWYSKIFFTMVPSVALRQVTSSKYCDCVI